MMVVPRRLATAPATAAVDTLYDGALGKLVAGHSADAGGAKASVARLDAPQTAKPLVARLFPLCDQISVGDALLQTPLVQVAADGLAIVVQFVNVARPLVVQTKDGPAGLDYALAVVASLTSCTVMMSGRRGRTGRHGVPSRILRSSSLTVGSISSHPAGGALRRPNLGMWDVTAGWLVV